MDGDKTEIDGFKLELKMLPAWDHVEATARLMKIVGAGIGPLVTMFNKPDVSEAQMIAVVIDLVRRAPIDELMVLNRSILKDCVIEGDLPGGKKLAPQLEPIFDRVFRGKPTTAMKVIAWAMKVQFAGFFADLKSALPARKSPQSQEQSSSNSPNPSEPDGPASDSSPTDGQPSPS